MSSREVSERGPDRFSGHRLAPCPDRPNCVSSMAPAGSRYVAPFAVTGDPAVAMARLRSLLERGEGLTVVTSGAFYLHAECRSRLGFVDDLEFSWDPAAGVCHVRSASRLGYWDMGVNRRRVEAIRRDFLRETP